MELQVSNMKLVPNVRAVAMTTTGDNQLTTLSSKIYRTLVIFVTYICWHQLITVGDLLLY